MPMVLAERLKHEADKLRLTQEELAKKVGISREQCGKQLRKQGNIRINENTARGYETIFKVPREELATPPKDDDKPPSSLNRITLHLSDEELLILRLTSQQYGMDGLSILRMSTALFIIVAELQLSERAKRLETAEAQMESVSVGFEHLADALHGKGRIQEALDSEKLSIKMRDVTGSSFSDDEWHHDFSGNSNLFESYVERMLQDLTPEIYEPNIGALAHDLFQQQIDELTQGDVLARMALLKRDVHPKELVALPAEERVAFLHKRCSDATRKAFTELAGVEPADLLASTDNREETKNA